MIPKLMLNRTKTQQLKQVCIALLKKLTTRSQQYFLQASDIVTYNVILT